MPKKDDTKNLYFISQITKSIPGMARELVSIKAQFETMIQMTSTMKYDSAILIRQANDGMRRIQAVDKDLRQAINLAATHYKKLSKDERLKAGGNLRGQFKTLENKYFKPAVAAGAKLYAHANKLSKSELIDTPATGALDIILVTIQALLVVYKYFTSENRKF